MFNHNEYLNYELPQNWCAEEKQDNLLIYNPNGNGAITISFFNALDPEESLEGKLCILAKRFIEQNSINLHSPLVLLKREGKTFLSGTGTMLDGDFMKLWFVAKSFKIVFATYISEEKNEEVEICDSIIDSIKFKF